MKPEPGVTVYLSWSPWRPTLWTVTSTPFAVGLLSVIRPLPTWTAKVASIATPLVTLPAESTVVPVSVRVKVSPGFTGIGCAGLMLYGTPWTTACRLRTVVWPVAAARLALRNTADIRTVRSVRRVTGLAPFITFLLWSGGGCPMKPAIPLSRNLRSRILPAATLNLHDSSWRRGDKEEDRVLGPPGRAGRAGARVQ